MITKYLCDICLHDLPENYTRIDIFKVNLIKNGNRNKTEKNKKKTLDICDKCLASFPNEVFY